MSIKITFKKNISNKLIKNYVLFSNDDFKINALNSLPIEKNTAAINKTIKSLHIKNKDFIFFNLNPSQKIILIKVKNASTSLDNEKKGADFYNFIKLNSFLI